MARQKEKKWYCGGYPYRFGHGWETLHGVLLRRLKDLPASADESLGSDTDSGYEVRPTDCTGGRPFLIAMVTGKPGTPVRKRILRFNPSSFS